MKPYISQKDRATSFFFTVVHWKTDIDTRTQDQTLSSKLSMSVNLPPWLLPQPHSSPFFSSSPFISYLNDCNSLTVDSASNFYFLFYLTHFPHSLIGWFSKNTFLIIYFSAQKPRWHGVSRKMESKLTQILSHKLICHCSFIHPVSLVLQPPMPLNPPDAFTPLCYGMDLLCLKWSSYQNLIHLLKRSPKVSHSSGTFFSAPTSPKQNLWCLLLWTFLNRLIITCITL